MEPPAPHEALGLAVYVHFPWCLQKCPYCDFASEAEAPARIPHEAYADAVIAELTARVAAWGGPCRALTLFFGGGTPSLWDPEALGRVIASVRGALGAVDEVTLECNPTSLDFERARRFREAGVDRLSLGVQSLRDRHLRYLGRLHDASEALRAVRDAVRVGGLRVSADVMFGLADQWERELLEDVSALVSEGVDHLSCYALTIEPETRFGELARKGRLPRLVDDEVAALYESLEDSLERLGFAHYEVSNYALPGCEARHNLNYWRGEAYLGLGAGAVGCLPSRPPGLHALRWRNDARWTEYVQAIARGSLPPGEREVLDPETRVREGLLLGMRTLAGVDLARLARETGVDPRRGREQALERERARGNVTDEGGVWRIPRARWLLADEITARLF